MLITFKSTVCLAGENNLYSYLGQANNMSLRLFCKKSEHKRLYRHCDDVEFDIPYDIRRNNNTTPKNDWQNSADFESRAEDKRNVYRFEILHRKVT